MKNRKLVDPVHFFNAEGVSVLSFKYLQERIVQLEAEIERLTRMLRAQAERKKLDDDKEEASTKQ